MGDQFLPFKDNTTTVPSFDPDERLAGMSVQDIYDEILGTSDSDIPTGAWTTAPKATKWWELEKRFGAIFDDLQDGINRGSCVQGILSGDWDMDSYIRVINKHGSKHVELVCPIFSYVRNADRLEAALDFTPRKGRYFIIQSKEGESNEDFLYMEYVDEPCQMDEVRKSYPAELSSIEWVEKEEFVNKMIKYLKSF